MGLELEILKDLAKIKFPGDLNTSVKKNLMVSVSLGEDESFEFTWAVEDSQLIGECWNVADGDIGLIAIDLHDPNYMEEFEKCVRTAWDHFLREREEEIKKKMECRLAHWKSELEWVKDQQNAMLK